MKYGWNDGRPGPVRRDTAEGWSDRRSARRIVGLTAASLLGLTSGALLQPSVAGATPMPCTPSAGYNTCKMFYSTGDGQTFTVPSHVTSVHVELRGSDGGFGTYDGPGLAGRGGTVTGVVSVISGEQLAVTVGSPTYGGGGVGGAGSRGSGGNGGGLSAIWRGAAFGASPLLIAAGGGGAAGATGHGDVDGGQAGGSSGTDGSSHDDSTGGGGATQTSGGAGGPDITGTGAGGQAGAKYTGGDGGAGTNADGGGGGGAGWYGGGGGGGQTDEGDSNHDGGGGGGSSYLAGMGVTDASTTAGSGGSTETYGHVQIDWNVAPTTPPAPAAAQAKVAASRTAVSSTGIHTTCSLTSGSVSACNVTAFARVNGHRVVIGHGSATRKAGQQGAALPTFVVLNTRGTAAASQPGGVRAELLASVRQSGTGTVRNASTSIDVVAPKVTLKPIHFAFDSARLSKPQLRYLVAVRQHMASVRTIECTGHTDYAGENAHEKKLSKHRARNVCAALRPSTHHATTEIKGVGGAHPRTTHGTARSRRANRFAAVTLRY